MCSCVGMRVRAGVFAHACVRGCVRVHMSGCDHVRATCGYCSAYISMCVRLFVCAVLCAYAFALLCICVCVCVYACMGMCVRMRVCTHGYTVIYTCA